jgi:hypothetical protein
MVSILLHGVERGARCTMRWWRWQHRPSEQVLHREIQRTRVNANSIASHIHATRQVRRPFNLWRPGRSSDNENYEVSSG